MKIAVAGLGYVGIANAVVLSAKHEICAFDINREKVRFVNEKYGKFCINATVDGETACRNADFVIIATPTDFEEKENRFDTSSVESVIRLAFSVNPGICAVVKSTVPIGFTDRVSQKKGFENIIFSPEFLREGSEISDCLNPSRIVIGRKENTGYFAEKYLQTVKECVENKDVPVVFTGTAEAEAIKLFSNVYLAMRVAFFNELDTYAIENNFCAGEIINGVCMDPRIGSFYNNPSFGYGGYCLPKDTKQLLAEFDGIPQSMFSAVVESNRKRMDFIADRISEKTSGTVGIYRILMKSGSDNFRTSAVVLVMERLKNKGIKTVVYEPLLEGSEYCGCEVLKSFDNFKKMSDMIVANRYSEELSDVKDKVYTRDIYLRD